MNECRKKNTTQIAVSKLSYLKPHLLTSKSQSRSSLDLPLSFDRAPGESTIIAI